MKPHLLALAGLIAVSTLQAQPAATATAEADTPSRAEQAVFNDPVLSAITPPFDLHYRFQRSVSDATLPPAFEDMVLLELRRGPDGNCCAVRGSFLSGAQTLKLPDIDDARVNPVTLFFLEREVRELARQTGGQAAHFRKRIRLALVDGARVRGIRVSYDGRELDATEISIAPFADDPQRSRYPLLATLQYRFIVAPDVPGGVFELRALVPGADAQATPRAADVLRLVPSPVPAR